MKKGHHRRSSAFGSRRYIRRTGDGQYYYAPQSQQQQQQAASSQEPQQKSSLLRKHTVKDAITGREISTFSYTWETNFERSWDLIQEDPETGRLSATIDHSQQLARKQLMDELEQDIYRLSRVRRGMMRFVVLCIDLSRSMNLSDMRPSRAEVVVGAAQQFVMQFYDQNPISQMAIVATRNGVAETLSSLGSNPLAHVKALLNALNKGSFGDASLQNLLLAAQTILLPIPAHASREIIVLFGSIATCDPGDVHTTIADLKNNKILASVICAAGAEVYVLKCLVQQTGGKHIVPVNEDHLEIALQGFLQPPPASSTSLVPSLVRMGFPILRIIPPDQPAPLCVNDLVARRIGYECPRCGAWLSDVPIECTLCSLTLLSSPHLARSYHHLFPVPRFEELVMEEDEHRDETKSNNSKAANGNGSHGNREGDTMDDANISSIDTVAQTQLQSQRLKLRDESAELSNGIQGTIPQENGNPVNTMPGKGAEELVPLGTGKQLSCFACMRVLYQDTSLKLLCPHCMQVFCVECDSFIHESLHNCPGCQLNGGGVYA